MLREILRELDDKVTAEELDMMIQEIDSDGSGTVDFDGKAGQGWAETNKPVTVTAVALHIPCQSQSMLRELL